MVGHQENSHFHCSERPCCPHTSEGCGTQMCTFWGVLCGHQTRQFQHQESGTTPLWSRKGTGRREKRKWSTSRTSTHNRVCMILRFGLVHMRTLMSMPVSYNFMLTTLVLRCDENRGPGTDAQGNGGRPNPGMGLMRHHPAPPRPRRVITQVNQGSNFSRAPICGPRVKIARPISRLPKFSKAHRPF